MQGLGNLLVGAVDKRQVIQILVMYGFRQTLENMLQFDSSCHIIFAGKMPAVTAKLRMVLRDVLELGALLELGPMGL